MALITLDQAKAQIRGYEESNDIELQELIDAASAMVLNYITVSAYVPQVDSGGEEMIDSSGDPVDSTLVRPEVQTATKMMTSMLWRHRDENPDGLFDRGYLPMPVTAILYPLRDPALA